MFDHIIGSYRLLTCLKQEQFMSTYLCEDAQNQRQVVMKTLHMRVDAVAPQAKYTFLHAAHIMARLEHPNIVPLYNLGEQGSNKDEVLFLVTAYAARGSVRQQHPKGSHVPLETIVAYVKQSAAALHHAHNQDILHTHLKPENILLGDRNNVLVSDFGFSEPLYPQTEVPLSSALYMAPEQIVGKPQPASDQYALGVMVYEWLSGMPPFTGSTKEVLTQHSKTPPPSLREKLPQLSPLVEEVVMIALAKDPKLRFASVTSFATAFEQASVER